MKRSILATAVLAWLSGPAFAETPIKILAAQNFYAEVATAIGGDRVSVETVAMPADADPHDFEPAPSVARSVSDAAIVVFNGADYDHWMEHLLESTERPDRQVIEAAQLIGVEEGDNPHVWYDPRTIPAVAEALAATLAELDPADAANYETRKAAFLATVKPVGDKVAAIRDRFAGSPIAATEPVFGYMADALGLKSSNAEFQAAIMNETEPSAKDVAALESYLREHKVKALIYNTQVTDAMTEQLLSVAKEADVPVVGVTETTPEGKTYPEWMLDELDALEKALAGQSS
jgi:zinc/manganese transport system substrate-binding protein